MENLMMFITHIIKTVEYFAVEGFPTVPIEYIPEAIIGFGYNLIKILTIYVSL